MYSFDVSNLTPWARSSRAIISLVFLASDTVLMKRAGTVVVFTFPLYVFFLFVILFPLSFAVPLWHWLRPYRNYLPSVDYLTDLFIDPLKSL